MRFVIFRVLIYVGLGVLLCGLYRVQVLEGPYYRMLGEKNRVRLIPVEAPRGRVFDRRGNLLATNRASYDVIAMPEDVRPEVYPRLSKLLNLDETKIRERMSAPREYPFAPALIAEDVSRETAFLIEERRPELPGVSIQISGLRFYPYGETASHLIGFIGKLNAAEYAARRDQKDRFGMNSFIGRAGLEKICDEKLRGWRGGRQLEVNAMGKLVQILSERDAEPGEDLTVTLDLEFQKRIMELIKDKNASVAVLDLRSDELLALASSPAYDPNIFASPGRDAERLQFLKDAKFPMLDRGVSSAYPAGSVFKLVTALAALELGKITPQTRFFCPGFYRLTPRSRPSKCWNERGHGSIDLYQAIERSCNVYFWNVARKLKPEDIAAMARRLGLGESIDLETTNIAPGLVPDPEWKKKQFREKWYQGETLSFAIGQSYLLTTPVQILRLVATIAKDGEWVEPHLLKRREGDSSSGKRLALRKSNFRVIKQGMLKVVESDYGTGQLARVDFGKFAAKTGSAQSPPEESHAWMTGFFPYEDPQLAFVVFVEHGGSGGIAAAKLVRGMLEIWRELNVGKMA